MNLIKKSAYFELCDRGPSHGMVIFADGTNPLCFGVIVFADGTRTLPFATQAKGQLLLAAAQGEGRISREEVYAVMDQIQSLMGIDYFPHLDDAVDASNSEAVMEKFRSNSGWGRMTTSAN